MTTSELNLTETDEERQARLLDNHDHCHDPNGVFIQRQPVIDGSYPVDEESGLRLAHELMEPWQYPIGHSAYSPHPNSIAAS